MLNLRLITPKIITSIIHERIEGKRYEVELFEETTSIEPLIGRERSILRLL